MKAVVVYESMYGNTHLIANAVAEGLRAGDNADVLVAPVDRADAAAFEGVELVVVGGPTHAHGLSHESTRKAAAEAAHKPESPLVLEPDAEGPGLREWFADLGPLPSRAAAFDTRLDGPAALTGRASKGIAKLLRHHGCELIAEPESFLVTRDNHLEPDEEAHARAWGATLAASVDRLVSS